MRKAEFNDAQWEVTRFLDIPIATGVLSNKTDDDLGNYDEYDINDDEGGGF
jgi:hypothetical protein